MNPSSSSHTEKIKSLVKIFQKPFPERTPKELEFSVNELFNLSYFQRHIADPPQRIEFIKALMPFMKYDHFPKGTAIYHQGDPCIELGIILQGKATKFSQKDKKLFRLEVAQDEKHEDYKLCKKLVDETGVLTMRTNWHSLKMGLNQAGASKSPENVIKLCELQKAYEEACDILKTTVERILTQKLSSENTAGYHLKNEDKLLLLHYNHSTYFQEGVPYFRKIMELRDGDAIQRLALMTGMSARYTIIASEEIHMVTIPHKQFSSLYNCKYPMANIADKKEFICSVFPDLVGELATRLALIVEEKSHMNRDVIYEQDEVAKAFYIIKSGGVQFVTFEDCAEKPEAENGSNEVAEGQKKKTFNSKQQLAIGSIGAGSVFGEEELVARTTRKFYAVCNKSPTLIYTIKSDIYYEVIEKYFPTIAEAIKSGIKVKTQWREHRLDQGKKVTRELLSHDPNSGKNNKDWMVLRSTRLMDPVEARFMNIQLNRPELIFETQSIKVTAFEERHSRNVHNKVEITTCDPDQKVEDSGLKRFESTKQKLSIMKKSPTVWEEKHLPPTPKVRKVKTKLWERCEGMGVAYYMMDLQNRSQPRFSPQNSLMSSNNSRPSPADLSMQPTPTPGKKTPPTDNKLSMLQTDSILTHPVTHTAKNPSINGKINNMLLTISQEMASGSLHSPIQSYFQPSELRLPSRDEPMKSNHTPKSSQVYKRITSFTPRTKKLELAKAKSFHVRSIHVKSVSQHTNPLPESPSKPQIKVEPASNDSGFFQTPQVTGRRTMTIDINQARALANTPKHQPSMPLWTATPKGKAHLDLSNFSPMASTPKRVFMLNKGKGDAKPMHVDIESGRFSEKKEGMSFSKRNMSSPKLKIEVL